MPYCGVCGKRNSDYANYCYNCGATLKAVSIVPPPASVSVTPATELFSERRKISRNAALLASILGLFVMGMGHFYIGDKRKGLALAAISISVWIILAPIWMVSVFLLLGKTPPLWMLEPIYYLWQPNSPIAMIFQAYLIAVATLLVIIWAWQTYDAYREAKTR